MKIMKIEPSICSYIDNSDNCYYLMDYHSRMGYEHSKENNLIFNFKKKINDNGQQYKKMAIARIADMLIKLLADHSMRHTFIFVPAPPSKMKSDSLYDDRMIQVLDLVKQELAIPYADIISRAENVSPLHDNQTPRAPENHNFTLNIPNINVFDNKIILIIDDVVTSGSTYKATKMIIQTKLENNITGIFIARAM